MDVAVAKAGPFQGSRSTSRVGEQEGTEVVCIAGLHTILVLTGALESPGD